MSIEKNKEEIKERLLNARALSDDELEQVTGGETGGLEYGVLAGHCPDCRFELRAIYEHATSLYWDIYCRKCGFYNNQGLTHEQVQELYG